MKKIPYFNCKALFEADRDKFSEIMIAVAERGVYNACEELDEFEKELAKYFGCKFAVGVADGTSAIILAQ